MKDIFELVNAIVENDEENVKKVMNRFCLCDNVLDLNSIDKDIENILNKVADSFLWNRVENLRIENFLENNKVVDVNTVKKADEDTGIMFLI